MFKYLSLQLFRNSWRKHGQFWFDLSYTLYWHKLLLYNFKRIPDLMTYYKSGYILPMLAHVFGATDSETVCIATRSNSKIQAIITDVINLYQLNLKINYNDLIVDECTSYPESELPFDSRNDAPDIIIIDTSISLERLMISVGLLDLSKSPILLLNSEGMDEFSYLLINERVLLLLARVGDFYICKLI